MKKDIIICIIASAAAVISILCVYFFVPEPQLDEAEHHTRYQTIPICIGDGRYMFATMPVGTVKEAAETELAVEYVNTLTASERENYEATAKSEYSSVSEEEQEVPEDNSSDEYWESSSGGVPEESAEIFNEIDGSTGVYLGTWTVTAYCGCPICCGGWSGSPTASGAWPSEGWTIACGSLPFGTVVYIEGVGTRCVEDRGVDGEWIDVYFEDHDAADSFGMQELEVYLVE